MGSLGTVTELVLGAKRWRTNGDLIADVARLYIRPDDIVIDMTYGRGKWWTVYRHDPARFQGLVWAQDQTRPLVAPDPVRAIDDFRHLSGWDSGFADVVCFDPPYVAIGGRATSTIDDFNGRYGLVKVPKTPTGLHGYNMRGLAEAARICKLRGKILVKCKDYISSGELQPVRYWTVNDANAYHGLRLIDEFEHVTGTGPQPRTNLDGTERQQVHARRNNSVLLVFERSR